MKNLTWQNPEQLFVAQELINKVKSKCCGIKVYKKGLLQGELSQFYTLLELATAYEQKVAEQKGLEVELVKTKNLIQAKTVSPSTVPREFNNKSLRNVRND